MIVQIGPEKEELEPWLMKELDNLLSEIWLNGKEENFSQIFHLILNENVSGEVQIVTICQFAYIFLAQTFKSYRRK